MIILNSKQIEELDAKYRNDFLLEIVCDWFAIYEEVYGVPANLSFEKAWEIAEYLADRIEPLLQPQIDVLYGLTHKILMAVERGTPPGQLRVAVDQFCLALPAHEAAFALLEISLMK